MNESPVLLDDAIGSRESHARALPALLGCKKRFEDALPRFSIHPHARVGNRQYRVAPGRNIRVEPAVRLVQFHHLGFDQQSPASRHGVPRVQAQIHEHLFELRRIRFDRIDRSGDNFQLDVPGDYFFEEAHQSAGDGIDVHRPRLQHLAAREDQKFAGKRSGSVALFANSRKSVCDLGARAILFETELRPSQNGSNHIIKIVCDTSGKLSDGVKFLCLSQLALHGAQFGHVFGDDFDGPGMFGDGKQTHMETYCHDASIAPPPFALGAVNLSMFTAGSHELGMLFGEAEDVSHQIERVQPLGATAAEDGEKRGVCVQEGAIRRHAGYPIDGVFHQVPVPCLG